MPDFSLFTSFLFLPVAFLIFFWDNYSREKQNFKKVGG
jgi:hypothetical protein